MVFSQRQKIFCRCLIVFLLGPRSKVKQCNDPSVP